MSYFQFTQNDLNAAKQGGKKEMAKLIVAILQDADAKMEDPDTYDRMYVTEDIFGRLAAVIAPLTNEDLAGWQDHTLVYPEMLASDPEGIVRPFMEHHADTEYATAVAKQTENAIRQVLGDRHAFLPGYSTYTCVRMVERDGYGDQCGQTADHPVHRSEI